MEKNDWDFKTYSFKNLSYKKPLDGAVTSQITNFSESSVIYAV